MIRTSPLRLPPRIVIDRQRTTAPGVLEAQSPQFQNHPPSESLPLGSGSVDPGVTDAPKSEERLSNSCRIRKEHTKPTRSSKRRLA